MKVNLRYSRILNPFIVIFLLTILACGNNSFAQKNKYSQILWYDKPAEYWNEALPVGNGRLGAMVYGKPEQETIQFNEETLWTGQPHDYANKGAYQYLDSIRNLVWGGKQKEAVDMANAHFRSQPGGQSSYQPFGDILLNFPGHNKAVNYKRQLSLSDAIALICYEVDGVKYKREVFSSTPDQALVIRIEADKKGAINFTAGLNSQHSTYDVSVDNDVIIMKGKANDCSKGNQYPESKMTFEARFKIINEGGKLVQDGNLLKVENADVVTMVLVAATNFVNYKDISGNPAERCKDYLSVLNGKSYKKLRYEHLKDYQSFYNRVSLDLGSSEISRRTTDKRVLSFKDDEDPSMVALLYQYGRYLLISSSRPGTQPANLQGIWNAQLNPSWDSKYTSNINVEMNYWLAEITNLSELSEPLFEMIEDLSYTGKNVAKEHYNTDGWVTHHNTDIWRGAAPIDNLKRGLWVTGGAWLCQHLWWHYEFTGDKDYLQHKAYPIMKEACRFFVNYMVPSRMNPEWLITGPSNSPETGGIVMGPTMDNQILRDLFKNTIEAAGILDIDAGFVAILKEKRAKLPPNQIGKHGQLQEWLQDKDDPKNQHRHVSHLWGLHPGTEIHPLTTPELAEACKVSLSHRGDDGTGWSRAWKANFWARLQDGDRAFLLLKNLIIPVDPAIMTHTKNTGGLYPNLFDACTPFQIDGNFGATSAVTEILLQSHLRDNTGDYIQDVLPALPTKFPSGEVKGIKGRGGFEVSIKWKDKKLSKVSIKSLLGNKLNVRYANKLITKTTTIGETLTFNLEDF